MEHRAADEVGGAEYMEAIDGPVFTGGWGGIRTLRSARRCCSRSFSTLSSRNVFSLVGCKSYIPSEHKRRPKPKKLREYLTFAANAYKLTLRCSDSGMVLPLQRNSARTAHRRCSGDSP